MNNSGRLKLARFKPGRFKLACWVVLLAAWLFSASGWSAEAVDDFATPEQAALYLKLTKDHRCLKCQNQNLADSHASIAYDLKREIRQRVRKGESGEEISAYLVARYGDFVLYKPPFKARTYALWIGPFALLLLALWFAVRIVRQSKSAAVNQPDSDALARARVLLDE